MLLWPRMHIGAFRKCKFWWCARRELAATRAISLSHHCEYLRCVASPLPNQCSNVCRRIGQCCQQAAALLQEATDKDCLFEPASLSGVLAASSPTPRGLSACLIRLTQVLSRFARFVDMEWRVRCVCGCSRRPAPSPLQLLLAF